MHWLLAIIGFVVGIFVMSQILITICTALPLTISLDRKGLVRTKAIYWRFWVCGGIFLCNPSRRIA
jgi:hypothetical protein